MIIDKPSALWMILSIAIGPELSFCSKLTDHVRVLAVTVSSAPLSASDGRLG